MFDCDRFRNRSLSIASTHIHRAVTAAQRAGGPQTSLVIAVFAESAAGSRRTEHRLRSRKHTSSASPRTAQPQTKMVRATDSAMPHALTPATSTTVPSHTRSLLSFVRCCSLLLSLSPSPVVYRRSSSASRSLITVVVRSSSVGTLVTSCSPRLVRIAV